MQIRRIVLLPALALVLAACSGGTSATASPASSPAATRIEVELTDAFEIKLSAATVPVGVPVTFVVQNTGELEHEFYLGDEAAQATHEAEMAEMGGMAHDEPNGISVDPGATKELTFTFDEAGETLAGCHVPGHYASGMKAAITVQATDAG